jgi:hypothetical protein
MMEGQMPPVRPLLDWIFDRELASGSRSGGDPARNAFSGTLESLVREVLQNIKDVARGRPVRTRFRLIELDPADTVSFLERIRWENSLLPHLEAVAEGENGTSVRQALEELRETGRLKMLLIEDYNTAGLTGPEFGGRERQGNFTALCRDQLFSSKSSETSGGSHGMGKTLLWEFSGFSTVLFLSKLSEVDPDQQHPRFIGRSSLPWHQLGDGSRYDGGGWFGVPDPQDDPRRAVSAWGAGAEDAAAPLFLSRNEAGTGTSILVLGFSEPAEPDRPLVDVASDIEAATAKWFWPSMVGESPSLEVSVELVRDGEVEYSSVVDVHEHEEMRPFVELYRAYQNGATVESLVRSGDVVAQTIDVRIPGRRDGVHGPLVVPVSLVVRLYEPEAAHTPEADSVAYFRGPEMVVKYRSLRRLSITARPFHAALVCGEARGGSFEDKQLDRFLRAAEPAEHNAWESKPKLKEQYQQGYGSAITELEQKVRDEVKRIVSETVSGGERGPEKLMKMFKISGGVGGGGGRRVEFALSDVTASLNSAGEWEFSGKLSAKTEVPNGWRGYVSARYANEDNRTLSRIRIARIDAGGLRCMINGDQAIIMVPENQSSVQFQGLVDARDQAIDPRFATLAVSGTGVAITPQG